MSGRTSERGVATRPCDPDSWIRAPDLPPTHTPQEDYSARLTIDLTPTLRGQIEVTAFGQGVTVAEMLRTLLEREYPDESGAAS